MLNLRGDVARLAGQVVDIESVSGAEDALADEVWVALGEYGHLNLFRLGNNIVARTELGRPQRVIVAGHLDTVPVAGNLPGEVRLIRGREALFGRGACDMKGGLAVQLSLAASVVEPARDVTWIFYDNEEAEPDKSGMGRLIAERPDLVAADVGILMEPTNAVIEAGCEGTMRVAVRASGVAAHSARWWLGENAIHDLAGPLALLAWFRADEVRVDGLVFREGLNAVAISGGVAGNVIPDRAELVVNYRFSPDKSVDQAEQYVRGVFEDCDVVVTDSAPGARPDLTDPLLAGLVDALGGTVKPKYGWTDVARLAQLGIPAVHFGPGDPNVAHKDEEYVFLDQVLQCREALGNWL